jgi:hypothetical protein
MLPVLFAKRLCVCQTAKRCSKSKMLVAQYRSKIEELFACWPMIVECFIGAEPT